jgi:hypothetical protein
MSCDHHLHRAEARLRSALLALQAPKVGDNLGMPKGRPTPAVAALSEQCSRAKATGCRGADSRLRFAASPLA